MGNRHILNNPALRDSLQHLQLVHIAGEIQEKPRDKILGPLSHQAGGITNTNITILVDNSAVQNILHSDYELPLTQYTPRSVNSPNISNADLPGKFHPIFSSDRLAL